MAEEQADRHATLDEVAALAGVSRSVASRVINDAPHVSRAKREAVERAIRKLGYVPNPKARALATRQAGAAALVISRDDPEVLTDPFFAQVIAGVAGGLEEADLHMMLCVAATARGRERVEQLVRSRVVDGVMLMALHEGDPLARIAKEAGCRSSSVGARWTSSRAGTSTSTTSAARGTRPTTCSRAGGRRSPRSAVRWTPKWVPPGTAVTGKP